MHARQHRRCRRSDTAPLTNAEKRARTEAAWQRNPGATEAEIAAKVGVSHNTAGAVRDEMEAAGTFGNLPKADRAPKTDTLGRKASPGRPRKPRAPEPDVTPEVREEIVERWEAGEAKIDITKEVIDPDAKRQSRRVEQVIAEHEVEKRTREKAQDDRRRLSRAIARLRRPCRHR